jgi:hypothetical protein
LVTSAGQVRVTSTSDRILASISTDILTDPFAEAVGHLIKGYLASFGDFGLTLGAMTCDFVRILSENYDSHLIQSVRKVLNETLREVLEKNRLKIDVGNLSQMLSVLKTVLNSKPICKSGRTSRRNKEQFLAKTSAKILEGFLRTIPESGNIEFDLGLLVESGNNIDPELREGYFYPAPDIPTETEHILTSKNSDEKIRIIGMNIQLKDDCSELTEMFSDVSIEQSFHLNLEKEFLKRRIERLVEFCRENKGKELNYFLCYWISKYQFFQNHMV